MRLYGKNPVSERLKINPKSIHKIYVQSGRADISYICKKARKWRIPLITVPQSKMAKIGRNLNTQGIIAEVDSFCYTPFDDLILSARKSKSTPIFLDNLNDPQNLGAIIRSIACLGGFSLILPLHDSVEVTEAVLRVASGGDNHVKIAKVTNLRQAIVQAKKTGFYVAGAVVEEGQEIISIELPFPLALVVGSEQKGVRPVIEKELDIKITIPMGHAKLSFNVGHATTIFCYEIARQRSQRSKS